MSARARYASLVFYIALGTLFTHELDAALNHEWKLMPLLKSLPDSQGRVVFIVAHIPLFAGVIMAVASHNQRIRKLVRLALCTFLIVHAGLHYGLSNDSTYEFDAPLSAMLIYGGAVLGFIYVILVQRVFRG